MCVSMSVSLSLDISDTFNTRPLSPLAAFQASFRADWMHPWLSSGCKRRNINTLALSLLLLLWSHLSSHSSCSAHFVTVGHLFFECTTRVQQGSIPEFMLFPIFTAKVGHRSDIAIQCIIPPTNRRHPALLSINTPAVVRVRGHDCSDFIFPVNQIQKKMYQINWNGNSETSSKRIRW